jgi:hypothetical protein
VFEALIFWYKSSLGFKLFWKSGLKTYSQSIFILSKSLFMKLYFGKLLFIL